METALETRTDKKFEEQEEGWCVERQRMWEEVRKVGCGTFICWSKQD